MYARVNDWGDEISLVPGSGIQFVDFELDLQAHRRLTRSFIERPVGEQDGKELLQLLRVPEMAEGQAVPPEFAPRGSDRLCDIDGRQAFEIFREKWVPVPYLRVKGGADWGHRTSFDEGPTNWARVRIADLPDRGTGSGPTHRVVFAFDTAIGEPRPNRPYTAPIAEDVVTPTVFRLASDLAEVGWFFSDPRSPEERETQSWFQGWVNDWLMECYREYMQQRYPRDVFDPAQMEFRLEHWMRYVALLETLQAALSPPRIKFIDTVSRDPQKAGPLVPRVGVDLVLDIGNSRTCGLLIETYPNGTQIDLNNALVLHLRDLQRPERIYDEPFSSDVELSQARFGRHDLARRSSRSDAFFWPSLVRVGPEALRLRAENDGSGASTGMSSPKRYLWDESPAEAAWAFQPGDYSTDRRPPAIEVQARQRMNSAGDVILQLRSDRACRPAEDFKPASALTFSRSSFFSLMLAEVVMQAICMANSVGVRHGRQFKELPRVLRRLVLTLPPATTLQEQQIMKHRAEAALRLVWTLMGWEDDDGNPVPGPAAAGVPPRPKILLNLDEASCTHFVWLYGEIARKFNGAAQEYARLFGRDRPFCEPEEEPDPDAPRAPSLRVASIDIGGGTTDMMISTYHVVDNRALQPTQNFREGFRIAGDDLLRAVIEQMVLPAIEEAMARAGARSAATVLKRAFGGDRPDMPVQDKQLRRQMMMKVLYPAGLAILARHEVRGRFHDDEIEQRSIGQLLGSEAAARIAAGARPVSEAVLAYLEEAARADGAEGFRLEEVEVMLDFGQLRQISFNVLGDIADQLSEVVRAFDVDVLLLSGRPARLPSVSDLFIDRIGTAPDRVLALSDYRTDTWFPFRTGDNLRIADPKTCTAVGGMLCVLAERQIENFTLYTHRLSMRSTARYIGPIEDHGELKAENVLFSDAPEGAALPNGAAGDDVTLRYYAPMRIGFRQLGLQRWTTTPLYRLEFLANDNFSPASLPFTLSLSRDEFEPDPEIIDPDQIMKAQVARERLKLLRAEDRERRPRNAKTDFRLSLCTLKDDAGYWLDTGIFTLN